MIADILQNIFAAVGVVVFAGGGLAAITWLFFKMFAERWLDTRFERQLQIHRHAQERELEELRFRINSMFDRKTKLHQQEFEIVPEAWNRLVEAHAFVTGFISVLQSYPDVAKMNPAQLDEFLKDSKLVAWQQAELRESSDKNKYYQRSILFHRAFDCRNKCRELHTYTRAKGIFLPEDLKEAFSKLDGLIWNALVEHEVNEEHNIHPPERASKHKLDTAGKELLDETESKVRQRLWQDVDLKTTPAPRD